MVEGIKTNCKIWIKPDVMGRILRRDLAVEYKPLIVKGAGRLVMDAAELVHRKIGSWQEGDIMIRLISNLKLRKIKRNLEAGSYEKRIDLGNKVVVSDAEMFGGLDEPNGIPDLEPEYVGSMGGSAQGDAGVVQEEIRVKDVWEGLEWDDCDEGVVVNRPNAQQAIVWVSAMKNETHIMPETQTVESPKPQAFSFQKDTVTRESLEDSPLKFFKTTKTIAQSIEELPESEEETMKESKIMV